MLQFFSADFVHFGLIFGFFGFILVVFLVGPRFSLEVSLSEARGFAGMRPEAFRA